MARARAPKRNDRYTRWICECDCGNITEVRTDYLRSLHSTSCGCEKDIYFNNKIDVNKKYGKLSIDHYDTDHGVYICRCDCGNMVPVKGYNLSNGNTQSCGCLKSKGELKLNTLFTEMGIEYKSQYSFDDCRFPDSGRLAYFDYAIFTGNQLQCLIEYDGPQHTTGWGQEQESLHIIQARDKFKEYYCYLNNIRLIRIPYTDYSKINKKYILDKIAGENND